MHIARCRMSSRPFGLAAIAGGLTSAGISGEFAQVIPPPGLGEGLRIRAETVGSTVVVRVVVAADFNGDGFVDFFDFNDFIACFEGLSCPSGTSADFNGDGFVDFFDFDEFIEAFE
jgi:hypothetical protein